MINTYNEWLNKVSAGEKAELIAIAHNEEQLKRRFAMPLDFGTAGMRGIIALGTACINRYTVARATKGLANYIVSLGKTAMDAGVVISYDTRNFSLEFAKITAGVLAKCGINVYLFNGVRPVPMCSFAIRYKGAAAGVMITASHNPKEYNGYKVYGDDGAQMSPDATAKVVEYIDGITDYFTTEYDEIALSDTELNATDDKAIQPYITIIGYDVDKAYFDTIEKLSLSPLEVEQVAKKIKIVYTPIHGAGYIPVTTILSKMGIPYNVVEEQTAPDGNFPTVSMPNPEQPEALAMGIKLAKSIRSDIVIGTDPDCDRMGVALRDDKGEYILLSGNQIGAMLMNYILMRHRDMGTLPNNAAVVKTIVTTQLADSIARKYNATVFNVLTGFKFIGEKIKEWESTGEYTFMFGYEESFGYLSGTHARDKDAVVSAMLFAEMACYYESRNISLYDALNGIFAEHGYFNEVSKSIAFSGVDGMAQMSAVMDKFRDNPIRNIGGIPVLSILDYSNQIETLANGTILPIALPKSNVIKFNLGGDEWACVRPSGTEPKLKIYVSVKSSSIALAKARNTDALNFLEMLAMN